MHICVPDDAGIMVLTESRIYNPLMANSRCHRSIVLSFVVHARAKGGCQITISAHSRGSPLS
jgi:hypothetical protein